ncbi:hypothetical protein V1478_004563 [Vespula squamosa]|uniref:Uncharacterized protein n=1 Tax=Vespula squamosa TaxID=30214 RepID=A0ABD2BGV0_VESSQ
MVFFSLNIKGSTECNDSSLKVIRKKRINDYEAFSNLYLLRTPKLNADCVLTILRYIVYRYLIIYCKLDELRCIVNIYRFVHYTRTEVLYLRIKFSLSFTTAFLFMKEMSITNINT